MKKTYVIKVNDYQDATRKVKRMKKDELSTRDQANLKGALQHLIIAQTLLKYVETPIDSTISHLDEVIKMVRDDLKYEKHYGDSSADYRIVKRARSYLIMKGKDIVAEYEQLADARRNLAALKRGNPIDKI